MKIKDIIVGSALFLMAAPFTGAQDLDPTVVVNRAYEGKLVEMHKASIDMAVPDSVSSFALDFDYLVFDKPYKGADGFIPSVLTMKPAPTVYEPMKMYLNVGAGYTLHPTLDFVWSPFRSNSFKMDVYAVHRSYVGAYRSFKPIASNEGKMLVEASREPGDYWSGYDFMSQAGVDGRYEMDQMSMDFDVAYYGLASKDWRKTRMYDAVDAKVGLRSKPKNASYFMYDVQAAYRFGEDKINFIDGDGVYVGEHLFDLDATLGQIITGGHEISGDIEAEVAAYSYAGQSMVSGDISIVPHYVLRKGRWMLDAGVRISKIIRTDDPYGWFDAKEQIVYPDVTASFDMIQDAMRVYACLGGGNKLNTYSSLLKRNHHFDTSFASGAYPLMDVTVERVSASVGLEGRIGSAFSYDLRTGYVNYANDILDAVLIDTDPVSGARIYQPGAGYAPYQKYYAAFDWRLANEDFSFDGNVVYSHVWGLENSSGLFKPAALTGDVSFEYNWNKRIFAGIDCNFSTGRQGGMWVKIPGGPGVEEAVIPGFADLGVSFEYALTRAFSLWARGGNLLNMSIQRNPLYVEKGVNFTVGICLNL